MSNNQWGPAPGQYPPPPGPPVSGPPQPSYGNHPTQHAPAFGWGPQFGPQGPQPGYGAPGGPGPQGFYMPPGGPPRRSSRKGLIVGLALVGVVGAVVLAGAVLVGLAARSPDDSPTTAPSPQATAPTPALPTETEDTAPPTVPTTTQPTTRPTTTQPTVKPPPKRVSPQTVVTRDGFYFTGLQASVGCKDPGLPLSNARNTQNYYALVIQCLNKAWPRQVSAGRDQFRAPKLVFWSGYVQSPCSGGATVSFYCGTSETIYIKYNDDMSLWRSRPDPLNRRITHVWVTFTAAHEYGHHLQQVSGILPATYELGYDSRAPKEQMLAISRRIEVQASCLAAVFMGANKSSNGLATGAKARAWTFIRDNTGDENRPGGDRDHGSRASNAAFMRQGFATRNNAYCNTFTASASKVS